MKKRNLFKELLEGTEQLRKERLLQLAETLRNEGFSVSHRPGVVEDADKDCCELLKEPDEFTLYAFMDRASLAFEQFTEGVCNSHVLCKDEKSRKLCSEISDKLYELYQHAGAKFFDNQEQKRLDAKGDAEDRDRGD